MRVPILFALLLAGALALSGCPGPARGGAGGGGGQQAAAGPVEVVMRDNMFVPKDFPDLPRGRVTFRLRNEGPSLHNFAISKLNQRSPDVAPGQSVDWTADLSQARDATLQVICSQPGHSDAGMTGTITLR